MSLQKVDFVSKLLNVPRARVYELVRLKVLPVVRIGTRQVRFDEDALRTWIEGGGVSRTIMDKTTPNVDNMSQEDTRKSSLSCEPI